MSLLTSSEAREVRCIGEIADENLTHTEVLEIVGDYLDRTDLYNKTMAYFIDKYKQRRRNDYILNSLITFEHIVNIINKHVDGERMELKRYSDLIIMDFTDNDITEKTYFESGKHRPVKKELVVSPETSNLTICEVTSILLTVVGRDATSKSLRALEWLT